MSTNEVISFGPFSLIASERLLTRDGDPVDLGARSLDTLIALVSRPNEIVSKKQLLASVWPDVIVDEGSLRFHIASLRKALGDGKDGARYITTVAGRGYCFVAPLSRTGDRGQGQAELSRSFPHVNLPSRLIRMAGRGDDTERLATQLIAERFVTIVGAGGVGKTTVAIAVGHDLIGEFDGAVVFVDLGALADPKLVPTALATMLGLSVQTDDATPSLISHLRGRRTLLILDTCEHLIDAVADVACRIFAGAPQAHILATSREALRVEGEHVCKLEPLACPPNDPSLTAAEVETFPAAQLFIERARASGAALDFSDAEAPVVAHICRKLDGVALAIELAAGRVEAHGLRKTAALLDERLTLLWPGQRSAPPRQKTLQATLDWSYGLLCESERIVLRQLAVFVGYFTFEAALQVVSSKAVDQAAIFAAIESLIAKSMVAAHPVGAMMRYRLLDTTRAYLLQLDTDEVDGAGLAARHATYYRCWLEQIGTEWPSLSNAAEREPHLAALGNVRAALEWCFGAEGSASIGVELAAAAAPVFLAMSLLIECHRWSERALLSLDEAARGGIAEMRLQAGLGMSLMFTRNHGDAARVAFKRSLAIAEDHDDIANQMLLLGPLHMFHFRTGDFRASLEYGRRSAIVATSTGDPAAVALSHCLTGISLHTMGELSAARAELEATLQFEPASQRTRTLYLGFDYYNWAGIALARTLWLQGNPARAIERVRKTVLDAERLDHPVTLTIVLHWAAAVFLWIGDLQTAESYVDWFLSRAETHSLGPYLAVGRGLKGDLAIRRGDAKSGVEMLQASLEKLHAARYELVTTAFNIALAQGMAAMGRVNDGVRVIDETLQQVKKNGDACYMAELLRVKSLLLLALPHPDLLDAEICLTQSLGWSRRQSARAWELRAATDLAKLFAGQGRAESAATLLRPVVEEFTEGTETADVKAAARVLATLR